MFFDIYINKIGEIWEEYTIRFVRIANSCGGLVTLFYGFKSYPIYIIMDLQRRASRPKFVF